MKTKVFDRRVLELFFKAKRGDESARQTLIMAYYPAAKRSAEKIARLSIGIGENIFSDLSDYEDFVQDGIVGLIEAIDRSLGSCGNAFKKASYSAYIKHCVERSLRKALVAKILALGITVRVDDLRNNELKNLAYEMLYDQFS